MAVSVQFGTCSCENEVVNKSGSVTLGTAVSCEMVNTDILNPVLKVNARINKNYCYISDFGGRYYFIETIETIAGKHCLCHCHVDVLYTYASGIKGLDCFVHRNESINKWKRDRSDPAILTNNRRLVYGRNFGNTDLNGGLGQYFIVGIIG